MAPLVPNEFPTFWGHAGATGSGLISMESPLQGPSLCVITDGYIIARNGFTGDAHCTIFLRLTRGQSNFPNRWAGTPVLRTCTVPLWKPSRGSRP